jgi:hypothetical protein
MLQTFFLGQEPPAQKVLVMRSDTRIAYSRSSKSFALRVQYCYTAVHRLNFELVSVRYKSKLGIASSHYGFSIQEVFALEKKCMKHPHSFIFFLILYSLNFLPVRCCTDQNDQLWLQSVSQSNCPNRFRSAQLITLRIPIFGHSTLLGIYAQNAHASFLRLQSTLYCYRSVLYRPVLPILLL